MWTWFHKLGSPPHFYRIAGRWQPWLGLAALICLLMGLYGALFSAPADYQQGEGYRIIFVHVPSAWMSLFVYTTMGVAGAIALIWRMKLAEIYILAAAPVGAGFTLLALVTGALWGKPMWGTYWVWDARLTSELILFFLYLGVIGLYSAIEDPRSAARAAALLCVVGLVNVPIVHYSVEWWNSLHQGPILRNKEFSLSADMLRPLLWMVAGFQLYFFWLALLRMRTQVLLREAGSRWIAEQVA